MSEKELAYLLGEWEAFKAYEERNYQDIHKKLDHICIKLDSVNNDRWKLRGAIALIGACSGIISGIILKHIYS